MKPVVHLITTIERGGAELQLLTLASEQVRKGRNVTVIPLKGKAELAVGFKNIGVNVLDKCRNKNPLVQIYLIKRYLRNSDSILHCHLPRSEIIGFFARGKKKFIVSRHNSENFYPGAPKFASSLVSRIITKSTDDVISISDAVTNFLSENREIHPNAYVSRIYYGFKRKEMDQDRSLVEGEISSKKPLKIFKVGTIGRLADQKDYPTLMRAFKLLLNDNPNVTLSIVGDGPKKIALHKLATQLEINNSVEWVGKVADVYQELKRFDIFVLSSKYEGFGLVLLEALDAGLRVIASNNSSIIEVLGENYNFLFETGNSYDLYTKIVKAKSESTEITKYADERLAFFNCETMINQMDALYERSEKK